MIYDNGSKESRVEDLSYIYKVYRPIILHKKESKVLFSKSWGAFIPLHVVYTMFTDSEILPLGLTASCIYGYSGIIRRTALGRSNVGYVSLLENMKDFVSKGIEENVRIDNRFKSDKLNYPMYVVPNDYEVIKYIRSHLVYTLFLRQQDSYSNGNINFSNIIELWIPEKFYDMQKKGVCVNLSREYNACHNNIVRVRVIENDYSFVKEKKIKNDLIPDVTVQNLKKFFSNIDIESYEEDIIKAKETYYENI